MKKLVFLSLVTVLLFSCNSQDIYNIKGSIEGVNDGTVYLQKRESGKFVKIDSAQINDENFEIEGGSVDYPSSYYLSVDGVRGYMMFFLENNELTIKTYADSLFAGEVEGSVSHDEYSAYNEGLEPYYERNRSLFQQSRDAQQAGDEEKAAELNSQREAVFDEIQEYNLNFIKENPASYCSPEILRSVAYSMSGEEIESFIDNLDPKLMETKIIIDLNERVEKLKKVAIGKKAPDFTQNDPDGNPVSLSDVLGPDLLLLDFWAAWCGPCRRENPNVVAVYNEFHDKGFDVFGVSLDREKEDWLEAVEADGLVWTQVSDLNYWNNEAAQLYAVSSIPSNFLLDSEGTIIAKNVRGDDLRKKVAEILGE
ncbi:MAG: AhpC/TSA family protein [Bacteroidales bacterium]|nr:AhpC/TSA family protein [Bacteroidales bacterium]